MSATRYLLVDDTPIAAQRGLTRTVHAARKYDGNPIMVAEPPWEGPLVPSTVLVDDSDGADRRFKMWYLTHARVPGVDSTYVAGFATSADGIHWERPSIGDYEYEGSRQNNLCLGNAPGGMGVIADERDPDPRRRFKALFWRGGNRSGADVARGAGAAETRGFYAAYSPGGAHWTLASDQPVLTGTGDTESLFGWDDKYGAYVAYVRPGRGKTAGEAVPRRVIGRSLSPDFVTWSDPVAVVVPDADDPPLAEHYFMPVQRVAGHYVGIVHVFVPSPDPFGPFWPELTASRDGIRWRRLNDGGRQRLIHQGEPGSFDAGMIRCARGIIERGDELWIYYGGWHEDHGVSRQHRHMTTPRAAQRRAAAIGLAILRRDGFVSLDAAAEAATLTTHPLPWSGEGLTLNARVTAPAGYVTAALLDVGDVGDVGAMADVPEGSGHPLPALPGYGDNECDTFTGDATQHRVTWRGSPGPDSLAGAQVAVRLTLRHAALYSFAA
jgi:hypothetical protein